MAEESTVVETGAPGGEPARDDKTFTQDEVDRIVKERLARAKATPPSDYEDLKKAAAELGTVRERAERAERELERARAEAEHRELVAKVARESGVPAELLHGESEEELAANAAAIASYVEAQRPGYPADKGGSPGGGAPVTAESIEKIRNPIERVRMRTAHPELYR